MAKLISSSLVRTTATAASISRLELTRSLIFHSPRFQSHQHLIQHLKNSLSRALDFFPPLAGRLVATPYSGDTASFSVDCNNAVAASVTVSDLLGPSYTDIDSSLFPINVGVHNYEGISKPLFAVQVTELDDGLFIGCTANHAVVDGASFWHFLNYWSEISRGAESISKSPIFDRCKEKLGQLKAKANSEAATDKISTLQALMAHLWRCTVRSQATNNDPITGLLAIAIGTRAKMSSLPDGYFGNALGAAALAISEGELLQKGLGAAALRINEVISGQTDVVLERNERKKVVFGEAGAVSAVSGPPLIVSGSHRYDVYGCDFGWGKPVGVRSTKDRRFDGLVVVLPAAEGGGIDLEVCLKEETVRGMEEFLSGVHQ